MASGPTYRVKFRRRREGRTDYRHRLGLLRSGETRAIVRRQSRNIIVQFADFSPEGDVVIAQATARELASLGWKGHTGNVPAAYLAGLLAGTRAKAAGCESAVLDLGQHTPRAGSALFAALKGILDAGVEVPHGEDVLPEDDRLTGAHISDDVAALASKVRAKIQEGSA